MTDVFTTALSLMTLLLAAALLKVVQDTKRARRKDYQEMSEALARRDRLLQDLEFQMRRRAELLERTSSDATATAGSEGAHTDIPGAGVSTTGWKADIQAILHSVGWVEQHVTPPQSPGRFWGRMVAELATGEPGRYSFECTSGVGAARKRPMVAASQPRIRRGAASDLGCPWEYLHPDRVRYDHLVAMAADFRTDAPAKHHQ